MGFCTSSKVLKKEEPQVRSCALGAFNFWAVGISGRLRELAGQPSVSSVGLIEGNCDEQRIIGIF